MVVYIEYAFLQNFALDGALLYLAFTAAKQPISIGRWLLSACLGGVFALIYPLLTLPTWAAWILKTAMGASLCLFPFGRLKNKKDAGRYAFVCVLFFAFTFATGGGVTGLLGTTVSAGWATVAAAGVCALLGGIVKKLYKKRALHRYLYPCEIVYKERKVNIFGYLDSGNSAEKNGLPVCFVSPDVFYTLFGEDLWDDRTGQVCDEIEIQTLSGRKILRAAVAQIRVQTGKNKREYQTAYFACSANMLNREYALLLNGAWTEKDGVRL